LSLLPDPPDRALFERPAAQTDFALLTCTHEAPLPADHPTRKDGWPKAVPCRTCGRVREVLTIRYRERRRL
jgi:hypothetical protein